MMRWVCVTTTLYGVTEHMELTGIMASESKPAKKQGAKNFPKASLNVELNKE